MLFTFVVLEDSRTELYRLFTLAFQSREKEEGFVFKRANGRQQPKKKQQSIYIFLVPKFSKGIYSKLQALSHAQYHSSVFVGSSLAIRLDIYTFVPYLLSIFQQFVKREAIPSLPINTGGRKHYRYITYQRQSPELWTSDLLVI